MAVMIAFLQSDLGVSTLLLLALWTIPWKGVALWKSARLSHKRWFILLLIVNTIGILEIFYIFHIARNYSVKTEEIVSGSKS